MLADDDEVVEAFPDARLRLPLPLFLLVSSFELGTPPLPAPPPFVLLILVVLRRIHEQQPQNVIFFTEKNVLMCLCTRNRGTTARRINFTSVSVSRTLLYLQR